MDKEINKKMKKLISIIIPFYNASKYLKRCIDSVINQNYKNLEIILVNDGSTDDSKKICDEFRKKDQRIKVINKKNEGVARARNEGIINAKGKYITFVDADDWLEKDAIYRLYYIILRENVDIVRGNFFFENENGIYDYGKLDVLKDLRIEKNNLNEKNMLIKKIFKGEIRAYVWLLLLKRELLVNNNILFKQDIPYMEDTIFYIELILSNSSLFMADEKTYHYFYNNNSATKSPKKLKVNIDSVLSVTEIIIEMLNKKNKKLLQDINLWCNNCFVIIMNNFFRIYKLQVESNYQIKKEISEICDNELFQYIMNNLMIKVIPFQYKIQYKMLKKKKINLLVQYYKFRIFLSKIKSILKRNNLLSKEKRMEKH